MAENLARFNSREPSPRPTLVSIGTLRRRASGWRGRDRQDLDPGSKAAKGVPFARFPLLGEEVGKRRCRPIHRESIAAHGTRSRPS